MEIIGKKIKIVAWETLAGLEGLSVPQAITFSNVIAENQLYSIMVCTYKFGPTCYQAPDI